MEQTISDVFGAFRLDTAAELLWNEQILVTLEP